MPRLCVIVAVAASALGCGGAIEDGADAAPPLTDGARPGGPDAGALPDAASPDADHPPSPANLGWIGGACTDAAACTNPDGICLTDGFPNGMCSAPCAGLCPDRGQPGDTVSLCADGAPFGAAQGLCVARCDVAVLPPTGCPAGYACAPRQRYAEPATVIEVCVPAPGPGPCPGGVDELVPIAYPDRGLLWIPAEAQCGGAFPLVVMLHGINPSSVERPSLGGGRRLEVLVRSLIDSGRIAPVILAEPVHFQGSSSLLYGAEFAPTAHLDRVGAVLGPRGLTASSLSYTGHSGAGCDADNGLYEVLAVLDELIPAYAPRLALWGLQDICYGGAYHYQAPRDALAGSGAAIINMWSAQGDPTEFEAGLFPAPPGPVDLPCSDLLYSSCLAHATEPWCSYRTRSSAGADHSTNPWFFVREAFPQVFAPLAPSAPTPCR